MPAVDSHDVPPLPTTRSSEKRRRGCPRGRVLILGAGVAGMTAAHELMDRGYTVHVHEYAVWPGGKAATQYPWIDLGSQELHQVPAEHGFRLFPSFYNHLTDTMGRIPFQRARPTGLGRRSPLGHPLGQGEIHRSYETVAENLIPTYAASTVRRNMKPRIIPRAYGDKLGDFLRALDDISSSMHLSEANPSDTQRFQLKCMQFITSCRKRRDSVKRHAYGNMTWWDFLGGHWFSPPFQREIETFVRTMVAMNARTGNARTVGNVGMQLLFDLATNGSKVDRVLNGPSSDQWLLPWEAHLRAGGVHFHYGHAVRRLIYNPSARRIVGIEFESDEGLRLEEVHQEDRVIAAMPLESMRRIVSRRSAEVMAREDPGLSWIREVNLERFTAWMTGIQFYLEHDVPIVRGHVYYPEAPWKISSVSQAQFWGPDFFKNYGRNLFRGILSVDVCDWQSSQGLHTASARGKPAYECATAEEVALEVWAQLRDSLTYQGRSPLPERYLGFHLDDNIRFRDQRATSGWGDRREGSPPSRAINTSPYFIHPAGSHLERPTASTTLKNLYLAGDYIRTSTDLATMEGANESARRAVNAILEADGFDGDPCKLFDFVEPVEFDSIKKVDEDLFNRGEPHLFEVMGLFEHFERGPSSSNAPGVVSVAASTVKGSQFFNAGLPNLISRLF